MTPPSSPKGSLEELFRHHLLESEAAAIPPLPHVWEQLDNSLLLAQNAQYRRRLRAYRWAMAASLLLAAMASGGWWRSQFSPGTTVATTAGVPAGGSNRSPALAGRATSLAATAGAASFSLNPSSIDENATLSLFSTSTGLGNASGMVAGRRFALAADLAPSFHYSAAGLAWQPASVTARRYQSARTAASAPSVAVEAAAANPAWLATVVAGTQAADYQSEASQLTTRLANLQLPGLTALPARLGATATPMLASTIRPLRPWQLQVAYAAGVYDPNVDFKKAPSDYDATLGPGTVATTRDAAAEYRHHLRPGLSQRLGVWATRRLGIGRWNLRTGLEIAQGEASSSTSVAFVGEQVATLNAAVQVQSNKLQTTTYRYRSVGVPIELSYASPLRHGLALYGHVGTVFSALLNVRSEVASDPEATRIYSYQSAGSPYRQLLTNVRSGVGVRYQPSHHQWTLNLGPVAEAGVLSLNSDPTQDFWNQRRPYSIGLEAGVEFNSLLKITPIRVP